MRGGSRRGFVGGGDVDGSAGVGGFGGWDGAAGGSGGWSEPGSKVLRLVSAVRWVVPISIMWICCGRVRRADVGSCGEAPSTVGTFLRSFQVGSVRQSGEGVDHFGPGVVWGPVRPKAGVTIDSGLDDLGGVGQREGGRRLRLHPQTGLHPLSSRSGPTPATWSAPACGKGDHSGVWSGNDAALSGPQARSPSGPILGSGPTPCSGLDQLRVGWSITVRLTVGSKPGSPVSKRTPGSVSTPRSGEAQVAKNRV